MKHIKYINEDFQKINEKLLFPLFKNENKLKNELLADNDFSNGDIFEGITNVLYRKWQSENNMKYEGILNYAHTEYGMIPYFSMMFSTYDGQVCNGGHLQYFDNGYASYNSNGYGKTYENINIHENFIDTFNQLDLRDVLSHGNKMYNIISSFTLELDTEIEQCSNCGGSGEVDCDVCNGSGSSDCRHCGGSGEDDNEEDGMCSECDGTGQVDCDECGGAGSQKCDDCDGAGEYDTDNLVPDTRHWNRLDSEWYDINEEVKKEYNDYLKTLILDGEKIEELVKISNHYQKYNL